MVEQKNQRIGEFIAEKLNISSDKFNELLEIQNKLDDSSATLLFWRSLFQRGKKYRF